MGINQAKKVGNLKGRKRNTLLDSNGTKGFSRQEGNEPEANNFILFLTLLCNV